MLINLFTIIVQLCILALLAENNLDDKRGLLVLYIMHQKLIMITVYFTIFTTPPRYTEYLGGKTYNHMLEYEA